MDKRMALFRVIRVEKGNVSKEDDMVIREEPLTIYLNGREFVTLLYTPEMPAELAIGFLRSEGLIGSMDDISSLRLDEERGFIFVETVAGTLPEKLYGKRTITSGCGKGTVFFNVLDSLKSEPVASDLVIKAAQVQNLVRQLQERAELFRTTGGVHSAALCSADEVLFFCEDIGRHNAVDKIVGLCLKNKVLIKDKILVSSGRVSSEILIKVAKLRIPLIISRAAPTTLSIELAEKMGVTLLGFVRGTRFNIYSNPQRITEVDVL